MDSTLVYDGEDLYYNYGKVTSLSPSTLNLGNFGVRGQSGSSIFFTNNNAYYAFGVQNFANESRHFRITAEIFYALKNIIEQERLQLQTSGVKNVSYDSQWQIYPNPAHYFIQIQIPESTTGEAEIVFYNLLGKRCKQVTVPITQEHKNLLRISTQDLPSGTYFVRILTKEKQITSGITVLH
ncbi:MAG: T9SS type A sorting domain-containing protein [Deferribacteres bacterium]|nr:T9SS type A sorting domain-containing protein [candidate division KSB1 bacterium]MCB9502160.1 T9SS type A sorting domain-containing protein [Deferribacteres bacterium]